MSYTLHNFNDGDILHAEELNEMEAQILENTQTVRHTAQNLTSTQQSQVRENIGAVSGDEMDAAIARAIAGKTQLMPEFANSVAECTDTSKLYVLPDGMIYGYMHTKSEPPVITIETKDNGYWGMNEAWTTDETLQGKRTNIFPVTPGDKLLYTGVGLWNIYSVYWYNASGDIIHQEQYNDGSSNAQTWEVTAPEGAAKARFTSFGYFDAGGAKLEVTWVLCQNVTLGYMWASTGHAFVPADYESRIQELEARASAHAATVSALEDQVAKVKELAQRADTVQITVEAHNGGYWNKNEQWVESGGGIKRTNLIPVVQGQQFKYTGRGIWNVPSLLWYDEDRNILANEQYSDGNLNAATVIVTVPAGAAYVRFFSHSDLDAESATLAVTPLSTDTLVEELKASNYLYGKKYVACGDSFTAGDFSGIGKTDETWDQEYQCYKTYPWWIAKRNSMTLVNEAICGTTMHDNGDQNAFCLTRYKEIPADADYITLCFGLNETNAVIGTLADETPDTVMGAWNVTLEYLIRNMPYAKIGIIIPDAFCTQEMREALISVAKYWGIPWLDTKGDPKVPLLMGGRYEDVPVNDIASTIRNVSFMVSTSNTHPNAKAHAYRSTIIENFLRSL